MLRSAYGNKPNPAPEATFQTGSYLPRWKLTSNNGAAVAIPGRAAADAESRFGVVTAIRRVGMNLHPLDV
jgi:hypothetical protein